MIKKLIGYIILIIHYSSNIIIPFLLLYSNNHYILLFIQFILFMILLSWYIFNDCLLLSIEDYFFDKETPEIEYNDYMSIVIINKKYKILKNVYNDNIFIIIIVFSYLLSIYKLIKVYNK